MRTATPSVLVLVLCLMAGPGAAQEHGAAAAKGAKAGTKTEGAASAGHGGAHEAPKPAATKPSNAPEATGKTVVPGKTPETSPAPETAHAAPSAGKATAPKAKTTVVELPISESDRRAADSAKDAHRATGTKAAASAEGTAPARVPVDELAVRLQRVLDAEAARKKASDIGGHAPTVKAASATRKTPVTKMPPPKAPSGPTRPVGVVLDWGSASVASHVTLTWEHDVDHRQPPRQVPSGARLSWEAERP